MSRHLILFVRVELTNGGMVLKLAIIALLQLIFTATSDSDRPFRIESEYLNLVICSVFSPCEFLYLLSLYLLWQLYPLEMLFQCPHLLPPDEIIQLALRF